MVSYLLSPLFLGTTAGPGTDEFVLHAIQEIEATRRQIVAEARLSSKPGQKLRRLGSCWPALLGTP
jgi:hypothetical protein